MSNAIEELEQQLQAGSIEAMTIGRCHTGELQVSIRRRSANGWDVYFGDELSELVQRACDHGPQRIESVVDTYQLALWA